MPRVIPPSPDAAALGKYGVYPVNLSSGLPTIDVPIYTVKSGTLELPISLSYHASGVKVDDIASWAGLGWALQAGGVVTRSVKGRADEYGGSVTNGSFLTTAQVKQLTDGVQTYNYLLDRSDAGTNGPDNESDVYVYSANGMGGKFIYSIYNELVQIPLTDNKITLDPGESCKVISDNGTTYIFDVKGYTSINANGQVATSFYLSKMISADKADTIYFDYFSDNAYYYDHFYASSIVYNENGNLGYNFYNQSGTLNTHNTPILQKIRFSNGYIDFVRAGDRNDRRKYRLTQVNIYSGDGVLKKGVKLNHGYFVSPNAPAPTTSYSSNIGYRLKLTSVDMLDGRGQVVGTYTFGYNTSQVLPPYWGASDGNNNLYFGQDIYGYYNGVISNTHLQSYKPTGWTAFNAADRHISTEHAQAAILNEITYPTGGKTLFYYESNSTTELVGGLRIKKIETYSTAQSSPEVKEYVYNIGFSNMFYINKMGNYDYDEQRATYTYGEDGTRSIDKQFTVNILASNPILPMSFSDNNGLFYSHATEIITSASGNKLGKTEYEYEYEDDIFYWTNVTVPEGVYRKRYENYIIEMSWVRGPVKKISVYGVNPDGSFKATPIKQTINSYTTYGQKDHIVGINVFRHNTYIHEALTNYNQTADMSRSYFQFFDVVVKTGAKKLTQTTENEFSPSGTITKTTTYHYEGKERTSNPHWLLTKTEETRSNGDIIQTIYQYPADFESSSIYAGMLAENIKSPVIKTWQTSNGGTTKGTFTHYGIYNGTGGTMYLPSLVQTFEKEKGYQDGLFFDAYNNNGDILQFHKANDLLTSYIWGYNQSLPVAQAVNAQAKDIFHTSFEDADGNSVQDDSKTGAKSRIGGYTKALSGLTNGNYILSYWQKNGSTWALQKSDIVVSNNAYTISLSGQIDEVRFYPATAHMSTYTYDPLVGITSQCDVANNITHYQYDAFGRLLVIKDKDNNVIKRYCYNYSGQPENCSVYQSDNKSGYYYSQNCGQYEAATAYYVEVPAGMFISTISLLDANNKAVTYAQDQANRYGDCLPAISISYNNTSGKTYTVELYNLTNDLSYWFNVGPGAGTLGNVTEGDYEIFLSSSESTYRTYRAGCSYTSGWGNAAFYDVPLSTSCYLIEIL